MARAWASKEKIELEPRRANVRSVNSSSARTARYWQTTQDKTHAADLSQAVVRQKVNVVANRIERTPCSLRPWPVWTGYLLIAVAALTAWLLAAFVSKMWTRL